MKLLLIIKSVASRLIVGISGILVARILSKNDYGVLASVASVATLCITFSRLGLNEYITVKTAKSKLKSLKVSYLRCLDKLQNATTLLMLIPGIFISIYMFYATESYVYISALFVLVYFRAYLETVRAGVIGVNLQSYGNNTAFANIQFIFSLGSASSVLILYIFKFGVVGYLLTYAICTLFFYLLGVGLNKNHISSNVILIPSLPTLRVYKYGLHKSFITNKAFVVSEIMSFIYIQGGVLTLGLVTTATEIARFSVTSSMISAFYIVPGVIYQWALPKLASLRSSKSAFTSAASNATKQIMLITLPLGFLLFLFSGPIILTLFGEKYESSRDVLKIMGLVFTIHSLCFIPAAILTALDRQGSRSKIQIISGSFGLLSTVLLGGALGGIAAAIGCLVAEIILIVGYLYKVREAYLNTTWEFE